MHPVKIECDARNVVGESAVWDDRIARLIWVDIVAGKIHALDPSDGSHDTWDAPGIVTSIGLAAAGDYVVGLARQVARWTPGQDFVPFATVETNKPANRLNEGVVGPDGAFWVGTMQNNINPDGSPRDVTASTGALHRVTADGQVRQISDATFGITNTLAWTGDGRLITADTMENTLYSFACDPQTGDLSDRTVFLAGFERGLPDGSCMDRHGYLWNCRVVGGGCVIRIAPDGSIDRIVDLPCSWPTSCAFGGPSLDRLFVTSARFTMTPGHLASHPHEGALFSLDAGVKGVASNRFG
jgi:sugar lactone lactonase YvrE